MQCSKHMHSSPMNFIKSCSNYGSQTPILALPWSHCLLHLWKLNPTSDTSYSTDFYFPPTKDPLYQIPDFHFDLILVLPRISYSGPCRAQWPGVRINSPCPGLSFSLIPILCLVICFLPITGHPKVLTSSPISSLSSGPHRNFMSFLNLPSYMTIDFIHPATRKPRLSLVEATVTLNPLNTSLFLYFFLG